MRWMGRCRVSWWTKRDGQADVPCGDSWVTGDGHADVG